MLFGIFHCKAAEEYLSVGGRPVFDLVFFKLKFLEFNGDFVVLFAEVQKPVVFDRQ